MGNSGSTKLPKTVKQKVLDVFREFDADNSGEITKQETLDKWDTIFGRFNTEEMFRDVDTDGDG